jgi:MFS family permease
MLERISIVPILLVNFIGTLGYSIVLPFLVVLVIQFGGNEIIYGIMGAAYSFFQLLGAPILGGWSDRFGRRNILLLSQVGTFLAWVLFVIALVIPNTALIRIELSASSFITLTLPLVCLFAARALDGITGGNVSVANAYLADITTEEDRKSNYGKMAASANIGFIIGPALAGLLGGTALGEMLPVLLAMAVSLVAIFVIAFSLRESIPCAINRPVDERRIKKVLGQEHKECYKMAGADQISFRQILQLKHIPFFLGLYFLIFLAFNFFYVAYPVHAVQRLKWSFLELGVYFSVLSFIMVCVQGPVLSRISKRYSDGILTIAGSILLAACFFLLTSSNVILIYLSVVLFSSGNGIMWPSFLSLLSKVAGQQHQGAVQGYASSAGSLASIVGLIAGGVVYGVIGVATFVIPGMLLLVIAALSSKLLSVEKN